MRISSSERKRHAEVLVDRALTSTHPVEWLHNHISEALRGLESRKVDGRLTRAAMRELCIIERDAVAGVTSREPRHG